MPDPRRHTAAEWPAAMARMEQNMAWMNRVVGNQPDPREPQLRVEEILSSLQRCAGGTQAPARALRRAG